MNDDGLQVYFAKFGLDSSEFLGGLESAQNGILKFYRDVSVSLGATMFIFDKVMEYGQKFSDLANRAAEFQSQVDKLTVTTGMSGTELYKWSNVARYADSDIGSLAEMIRKLSVSMTETGDAGDKARAMLNAMHVSTKNADGSARSMNEIFPDVIEGLKGIEDAGTRNTVATQLFGKSFQDLAGYMLLTKAELKGYFDDGFAPTKDQQQLLRDYEQAIKDLNTTTGNLSTQLGISLTPSLKALTREIDILLDDGAPLNNFFENLNTVLMITVGLVDDLATGWAVIAEASSSDADRGDKIMRIYQDHAARIAERKHDQEEYDLMKWIGDHPELQTEIPGMAGVIALIEKNKNSSSNFVMPVTGSSKTGMDAFQIRDMQLDYEKMSKITIPGQEKELKDLKKQYGEVGDRGSDAAKKIKTQIDELTIEILKNQNQLAEWQNKLTGVGASVAASGEATYNKMFASSLNTGGVGPDYAGFSDLANMSQSELEKIAAGGLGKSKAMAEKAQQYLSMMKSGTLGTSGSSSGTAAKKDLIPGSADQTKTVETEYTTQAKALQTLTDKTVKEYQKQSDAFKKYMEDLAALRIEQYPVLEKLDLIHWATSEEIAKVAAQKELDFMAACVNFGGKNPIIQNYIVMGKNGPDWTPPAFQAVKAPTLESADFTQVGAAVQGIVKKGLGEGTSASVTFNQTNNIVTPNDDGAADKVAAKTNKLLAGVGYLGGQL
jgi:hypothetical protein